MKKILFLIMLCVSFCEMKAQVVYSDYSDPDVCEGDDGDYWMTASSFQCSPGLPILHSRDLVHWELVNYAVELVPPTEKYVDVQHGCGIWAPSIRKHGDTYYIYWGDPDYGVYMVKAKDPRGKWSEPLLVLEGKGIIDPCPLWDDDGRVYLVNAWANSRCGFNSVLTVRELSADGTRVVGMPMMVYDGQTEGNHTIEGPKFYKHDGFYYILAPAGGVEKGWQVALRSKDVLGGYESKRVFDHEGIHQGGLIGDKFVCFQERGAYGRILHTLDVEWKDGWPMMKVHKPAYKATPVVWGGDEARAKTGLYHWHANYRDVFGFLTDEGVRVYGHNVSEGFVNMWEVPNLYMKKFDGEVFCDTLHTTITANADGQQSGFIIMGRDYCRLSVEKVGEEFVLKRIVCKDADKGGVEEAEVVARVKAKKYNAGAMDNYECKVSFAMRCDKGALCHLSYSLDGGKTFAELPTFQAREGKWIGAKYGVFSIAPQGKPRGWIEF